LFNDFGNSVQDYNSTLKTQELKAPINCEEPVPNSKFRWFQIL